MSRRRFAPPAETFWFPQAFLSNVGKYFPHHPFVRFSIKNITL
jgi:hypothetical protein